MKRMTAVLCGALVFSAMGLSSMAGIAQASAVGAPAPAFTLTDSEGKSRSLAEFKGKTVVLEWTNAECPFVKKHYGAADSNPKCNAPSFRRGKQNLPRRFPS